MIQNYKETTPVPEHLRGKAVVWNPIAFTGDKYKSDLGTVRYTHQGAWVLK